MAGVEGKIDLRLAPATETLDKLLAAGEAGQYDFAFIDADKPNYLAYYERCLKLAARGRPHRHRQHALVGRGGEPGKTDENTVAIRAVNETLHDDERIDVALLADRRRPHAGAQALAPQGPFGAQEGPCRGSLGPLSLMQIVLI